MSKFTYRRRKKRHLRKKRTVKKTRRGGGTGEKTSRCDGNNVYKNNIFPCKEVVTYEKKITGTALQEEIKNKIISYIQDTRNRGRIIFLTKIKINYNTGFLQNYSIPPFFPFTTNNVEETVEGIQQYLKYIAQQEYNSVEIKYYYERIYTDNENVMAIVKILPEVAVELNSSNV